jgi:SAM-dependent methyltransferase
MPTTQEMADYYEREYYETYKGRTGDLLKLNELEHEQLANRGKRKVEYIARHLDFRGKRVLDLGCGRGFVLNAVRELGPDAVVGVEPSSAIVDWLKGTFDFDVVHGTVGSFAAMRVDAGPALGDPFDIVLLMDVLEHLVDPRGDLTLIKDMLTPDGRLFIQTEFEGPGLDVVMQERISVVHVLYQTPATVRRLLERVGFEPGGVVVEGKVIKVVATPTAPSEQPALTVREFRGLHRRYARAASKLPNAMRVVRNARRKARSAIRSFLYLIGLGDAAAALRRALVAIARRDKADRPLLK